MHTACGFTAYENALKEGLLPDPPLRVDEWAEAHMVIPEDSGAAEPGKYRISRTPFAAAVMRALSPEHPARHVVVKAGSQLMKTQVGLNWACAMIDCQPSNMIILEPTEKLAKRVSARVDKVVRAIPRLRAKVATAKSRDKRNTMDTKEFRGGTLWILTGRSAANLSETPAKYTYADEVDRIIRELKGEGDPVELLTKRQGTFGKKAKSYWTSSPTEDGTSRIDELYRLGDQQRLYVPCPHCQEMQHLEWENLKYDLAEQRAWYVCSASGCVIEEHYKPWMLERGEWRATATATPGWVSFELSFLYAPLGWDSWLALAKEYETARVHEANGDREKMQVFYNTRLARCWSVTSTRVKPTELMAKAEHYPVGKAPARALIVTAFVDVQGYRLEAQVCGWGPGPTGLECWVLSTHVLLGDPTLPDVWGELDQLLTTPVRHASGAALTIEAIGIDSGDGDSTSEVYEFCRTRRRRFVGGRMQRVVPTKGASSPRKPIIANKPSKQDYTYRGRAALGGVELWMIGTDTAKDWIFNRFALEGRVAIHTCSEFPLGFYEQVLSEAKVTEWVKGRKRQRYAPIAKGIRNEQLDMLVGNLAMANFLGLHTHTAERWERIGDGLRQQDLLAEIESPAEAAEGGALVPLAAPAADRRFYIPV